MDYPLGAVNNSLPFLGITQATRTYGNQEVPPITTESSGAVASTGYVGINSNIKVGDYQGGQTQAGLQQGGITRWIA